MRSVAPSGRPKESFRRIGSNSRIRLAGAVSLKSNLKSLASSLRDRLETMRAAEREAELKAKAEKLAAWRNGESVRLYIPGAAMLRATGVTRDAAGEIIGGTLETSQGAAVPLAHALRVFRFLKLCRERGQTWRANGRSLRVGHFKVDSVDPNGDFRAGCHRIEWSEVSALAESLGVANLGAVDATEPTHSMA